MYLWGGVLHPAVCFVHGVKMERRHVKMPPYGLGFYGKRGCFCFVIWVYFDRIFEY